MTETAEIGPGAHRLIRQSVTSIERLQIKDGADAKTQSSALDDRIYVHSCGSYVVVFIEETLKAY